MFKVILFYQTLKKYRTSQEKGSESRTREGLRGCLKMTSRTKREGVVDVLTVSTRYFCLKSVTMRGGKVKN